MYTYVHITRNKTAVYEAAFPLYPNRATPSYISQREIIKNNNSKLHNNSRMGYVPLFLGMIIQCYACAFRETPHIYTRSNARFAMYVEQHIRKV